MSDGPIDTNLQAILVLLLKAAVLDTPGRTLRLNKPAVMGAEEFDLKMEKSAINGDVVLTLQGGSGPDTRIIVPHGASPLTIVR